MREFADEIPWTLVEVEFHGRGRLRRHRPSRGASIAVGREPVIRSVSVRRREVPQGVYDALPAHLDPVLRRIYAARQLRPAELNPSLAGMLPVGTLGGAAAAAELLVDARRRQPAILVIGDFDADGATATALVVAVLRTLGFERVSYFVPNRFAFGHGLSAAVAELAAARGPEIVITVDNGITSVEGVARANALGLQVLITDHHLPGPALPAARAIVNPNLAGERFASKALCGVGVAFYLMAAVARELDRRGLADFAEARAAVASGLDLVALGTVADLVPLDHNNRVLVSEGLRRIRAGRGRVGLNALFEVAGRDAAVARSADLAFGIAPRLNAAGRLTDMSLGVDCLLEHDPGRARALARQLDDLNLARRDLQDRMQAQADARLQTMAEELAADSRPGFCLFDPRWHEGIVGLVASRVKERTGRPVVAFAAGEEPGMLKGSARSVDGIHIRDVLAAIAARCAWEDMKFGGHAMAAGLRLPAQHLERFREALDEELARRSPTPETGRVLWTDGPLMPSELRLELADALQSGGPWGQGFPEPLFENQFDVLDQRLLKEAHLKLLLRHPEGGDPIEAIAFRETRPPSAQARFVYRLDVNDFGGRRRQQLVVEHIQSE